jgi:hypothetical protein
MSVFADQGTAAHWVLEQCLLMIYEYGLDAAASDFEGQMIRVEDGPHSRRSPSGAKRWMNCAPSVRIAEEYPEPALPPRMVLFTDNDAIAVQECLDYVEERVVALKAQTIKDGVPNAQVDVRAERPVSLEPVLGHTECDGTSDIALLLSIGGRVVFIEHVDYKHGAGVPVPPEDPQNAFYLVGTLCAEGLHRDFDLNTVQSRLTIVQPRCDKVDPRIRWIEIPNTAVWMDQFLAEVAEAEYRVVTDDPVLVAGDWCRFCPIGGQGGYDERPICGEYSRSQLTAMGIVDEGADLPATTLEMAQAAFDFAAQDTRTLTDGQIVGLLDAREAISGMLQAVEAYALAKLQSDSPPDEIAARYKVVRGRSNRKWMYDDEADMFAELKKVKIHDAEKGKDRGLGKRDLYEEKLKSPTQVEKILKSNGVDAMSTRFKAFQRLIVKPPGKVTIAPIEDPREAIKNQTASAEDAFGDL